MAPKMRHIPPFPFNSVARVTKDWIVMLNGDMRGLGVYSLKTQEQMLTIEKKGDFNILTFDTLGQYIVYSDGVKDS